MDGKKKYTKADFDNYTEAVRRECENTLLRQRERIDELKKALPKLKKRSPSTRAKRSLFTRLLLPRSKKRTI